jgi:hydrogenase maturation protease
MLVTRVTVLGIGNTLMGDDGIGAVVVRRLAERGLAEDVRVIERAAADMGLVRYFLDSERVVVVDALDAGAEPGSVFRFDPDDAGVTALRSNNIHGMGVGYLVTNARLIGARPEVVVYGVQVGDVRPRPDSLSACVHEAVEPLVEMIERDLAGVPPQLLAEAGA